MPDIHLRDHSLAKCDTRNNESFLSMEIYLTFSAAAATIVSHSVRLSQIYSAKAVVKNNYVYLTADVSLLPIATKYGNGIFGFGQLLT